MPYQVPVTEPNYQQGFTNMGGQLGTAIQAVPEAINQDIEIKRFEEQMQDVKTFKNHMMNVADYLMQGYPDEDKQTVKSEIQTSKDPKEMASKLAEFKYQQDIYSQTRQEYPDVLLPKPSFGIKSETYKALIQPAITGAQNKAVLNTAGQFKTQAELQAEILKRYPSINIKDNAAMAAAGKQIQNEQTVAGIQAIPQGAVRSQASEAATLASPEMPTPLKEHINRIPTAADMANLANKRADTMNKLKPKGAGTKDEDDLLDKFKKEFEAVDTKRQQSEIDLSNLEKEKAQKLKEGYTSDAPEMQDIVNRISQKTSEIALNERSSKAALAAYGQLAEKKHSAAQQAAWTSLHDQYVVPAARDILDKLNHPTGDKKGIPGAKKETERDIDNLLKTADIPEMFKDDVKQEVIKMIRTPPASIVEPWGGEVGAGGGSLSPEDQAITARAKDLLTQAGYPLSEANIQKQVDYIKSQVGR
jgi:hypothetical protein